MTLISIPAGPFKRELIDGAYEECGIRPDIDADEYATALRRLNNMLAEWKSAYGIDLGFDFPDAINYPGSVDDASGVSPGAAQVVSAMLALRIAPTIGKTLSAESRKQMAESWSALRNAYTTIPSMDYARNTMRGAGNRRWLWRSPFFPVDVAGTPSVNGYEASRDLTPNEDIS